MPPFTASSSITCPLASPFTLILLGFAATVTTALLGMETTWYPALT